MDDFGQTVDQSIGVTTVIDDKPKHLDYSKIENYKRNIFYWSLYDLANTIYSMGVVSLTIVPFVIILAISGEAGIDPVSLVDGTASVTQDQFDDGFSRGNLLISIVLLIGNLIMAVISPLLGAYADQLSKRKYFLSILTIFCLIFTASLSLNLNLIWVLSVFLLANLAYQMSLIVYDSMLPFIAKPKHIAKTGGFGIAFGYFGSFIAIGIAFYMAGISKDYIVSDENLEISIGYIKEYYPIVALGFLFLGLPLLLVKEARNKRPKRNFGEIMHQTKLTLRQTLKEIIAHKPTLFFMIGWLLFVDTANTTITYMAIIITTGLGLPSEMVLTVMAIGIGSAVLLTVPVGWLGDKIGPKKNFFFIGFLWTLALGITLVTNTVIFGIQTPKYLAYLIGIIVGPALGGTWVAQRQMISELAPVDRTSNYFGVANIFGRISSALGPVIWFVSIYILNEWVGLTSGMSTRLTIVVLALLLFGGLYLISKVDDRHEDYINGARHVGDGIWLDKEGNEI